MLVLADVDLLTRSGAITREAAETIRRQSRETMIALAVNVLLCGGVLAATGGLVFWLKDAAAVAVAGTLFMAAGFAVLVAGAATYRMFGSAATLIGAGMLIGGAGLELVARVPDLAGHIMAGAGAAIAIGAGALFKRGPSRLAFVAGSVFLMGVALHLAGGQFALRHLEVEGLPVSMLFLYTAIAVAFAGWFVDVRFVTALAIAPFAQMLDTGTSYFHAAYVFYSPEPMLTILQMGALTVACLGLAGRWPDRQSRHARTLALIAFVVANLAALVGSLWGDAVGSHLWAIDGAVPQAGEAYRSTLTITADAFAIGWAVALAAIAVLAAHRNERGYFNASLTFAGIHAYTQLFENFGDEPLAFVIGGLAAIPVAWLVWQANAWLAADDRRAVAAAQA